jgi:FtsH-binding integral membrane protein
MEGLFPTLFTKTFFILTVQLAITWIGVRETLSYFRKLHSWETPWITSTRNEAGQLDLHIHWDHLKTYFYLLLIADIAVFLVLLLWAANRSLWISMSLFSVWSILTGIEIAICLLAVDENLGDKVLAITATVVLGTGLVGIYSGIDFGSLQTVLFIALIGLILFNLARLFMGIPRATQRWVAGIGVVVFVLYLVHDFNSLAKLQEEGVNSWQAAMHIAIEIYLDIINLFLELLDAMSE